MTPPTAAERQWGRQWALAATALAAVRARELRTLTDEDALAATEQLLALVNPAELPATRRTGSGLVELQRLLHGRRP